MAEIGIIGLGAVGKAVSNGFKQSGHSVIGYDKAWDDKLPDDFKNTKFTFICVPTPTLENGEQDTSCIINALGLLEGWYQGIIVIKSTVLPGTTQSLQDLYDDLKLLCSPEFLTEVTAEYDFLHPDKVLIGYTKHNYQCANKMAIMIKKWLRLYTTPIKLVRSEVAEMTKYMINSYYALRVTYANQIYDLCTSLNIDYEQVRTCFELDKRVAPGHFQIFYKGKLTRGFDGKCLPKDVKTLLHLSNEAHVSISLLDVAKQYNTLISHTQKP